MPYEEEEDRGCEVKCPKGGGICVLRTLLYDWQLLYLLSFWGANSILLSKNSVSFHVFRVR